MNMEKEILTPGQKAVIDGYLQAHRPGDTFDEHDCMLVSTKELIDRLSTMCEYDLNTLSDYLASVGYRYHYDYINDIQGWIFDYSANS